MPTGTGPGRYLALEEIVKAAQAPEARPSASMRATDEGGGAPLKTTDDVSLDLAGQCNPVNETDRATSAPVPRDRGHQKHVRRQRSCESSFLFTFFIDMHTALPYTSCNIIASPCEAGL